MAKPSITTRTTKGSPLDYAELDANFTNLQDATLTVTDGTNSTAIDLNGTIEFTAGSNMTVTESNGVVTLASTAGGDASQTINPTTTVELTIDGSTQSPYTYYPTDSDANYFISVDNTGGAINLRIDIRSLDPDKEYHFVIERQSGTYAVYPAFYYNGVSCNLDDNVISNVYVCRVVMQDTTDPDSNQRYYVTGTITRDWGRFSPYTP